MFMNIILIAWGLGQNEQNSHAFTRANFELYHVVTLIVISFSFSVGAKATIIVTIQFVLYHVLI